METEEVIKVVDGIYKNILEKFNPGAKELISSGKTYLKALHGATAASRLFNDALAKIAVNAQQGGTTEIGSALNGIVRVYKEIQEQHMNILKAFYVDLLVPLETNLEKDTKVVQFEQKKFLQQHKVRVIEYGKATSNMKKYRKKKNNAEKELKSIQALEEEKIKLDLFCEQSLKNAMLQERRRYGFVLERQCSLAKHWMSYHSTGFKCIDSNIESWNDIATTREFLPQNVEQLFNRKLRTYNEDVSQQHSVASTLRKARSIDASCLDMRSLADIGNSSMNMPRAKSEYNLTSSPVESTITDRPVVKALYAYLSSGENQLSFLEDDKIILIGDRANKGWQYGENLRTQKSGWFPVAYVEFDEQNDTEETMWLNIETEQDNMLINSNENTLTRKSKSVYNEEESQPMTGDNTLSRPSKIQKAEKLHRPGPPPSLPAPIPQTNVPTNESQPEYSQNYSMEGESRALSQAGKAAGSTLNFRKTNKQMIDPKGIGTVYSSNDSGFSNEPPPQPDVDYSDEDCVPRIPIRTTRSDKNLNTNTLRDEKAENWRPVSAHIRQTNSFENLTEPTDPIDFNYKNNGHVDSKTVKRNKSFWKFSKSEDLLEGMALWKHRDLVSTENIRDDSGGGGVGASKSNMDLDKSSESMKAFMASAPTTLKRSQMRNGGTSVPAETLGNYKLTKSEIDKRVSNLNVDESTLYKKTSADKKSKMAPRKMAYDEDEQMYDEAPKRRNDTMKKHNKEHNLYNTDDTVNANERSNVYDDFSMEIQDTNFYDDDVVLMKTVKRKEILKQYYQSSGNDETEHNSSSSDPYCVVNDDQNKMNPPQSNNAYRKKSKSVSKNEQNYKEEFSTFRGYSQDKEKGDRYNQQTLLPRTRLSNSNKDSEPERMNSSNSNYRNESNRNDQTHGPWYDLWSNDYSGVQSS
ncbi:unnamed protein product [Diamesa serratosioi]